MTEFYAHSFSYIWIVHICNNNKCFFSPPEPSGSQGPASVVVCRPSSVVHTLQTSSPPKLLGRSKPTFMWSLLGKGRTTVYINDPGHVTKMTAMITNAKNHKNLLL